MIESQEIFKKIGHILNDLQDQYEYLSYHPERLNLAEVQLLHANGDYLASYIKIYLNLYEESIKNQTAGKVEEILPVLETPIIPEMEEMEARVDSALDLVEERPMELSNEPKFEFLLNTEDSEEEVLDFEEKDVQSIFDRKLSAEEKEILDRASLKIEEDEKWMMEHEAEEMAAISMQEPTVIVNLIPVDEEVKEENRDDLAVDEEGPEPFIVSEEVVDEIVQQPVQQSTPVFEPKQEDSPKLNINELLASASGIRANNSAPIKDLKQAINLNDKLLFIRDLFNGYNLAYAEAIDLVNKMPNFVSADAFLKKTYAEKNLWAEKEQSVARFYELLERRFAE